MSRPIDTATAHPQDIAEAIAKRQAEADAVRAIADDIQADADRMRRDLREREAADVD